MSREARLRVSKFMEAANKRTKKNKKIIKRMDKKTPAQRTQQFHDKLDSKLEKLASKHKVSITLRRNKKAMPKIVIGKLKNKSFGEVVTLFKSIPSSSPVPQKMNENGASFAVFGPRKMTATDKYMVTAKKGGKQFYWTGDGFTSVEAGGAEQLDEEAADKIERRLKNKGDVSDIKIVPVVMTADDSETDDTEDDDDSETDDTEDDSEDSDDEGDYDDSEDEANKQSMVDYINEKKISRDAVNKILDEAVKVYVDDLKTDAPIEDVVSFVYDVLGADDAKNKLKAVANQQSITASFKRGR